MESTIDKFGRIVIPKEIRESLGIEAGTKIEITEAGDVIEIRPLVEVPALKLVNGRIVHTGKLQADFDLAGFSRKKRRQRLRDISRQG